MRPSQITDWCQEILRTQARPGGLYIDATMGNGHDTLFFSRLAGESGRVLAFDIQPAALESTRELLKDQGMAERAELILDSHEHMDSYAERGSVDAICFNFGYLPGGDHKIATRTDTSIKAVEKGLDLLKKGGMMSLCIYSGGDTGFEERDRLLEFLKTLPSKEYTVIVNQYHNRKNQPPIPVFIFKN